MNIAGNEGIYIALPVLFNEPGDDMLAAGNYYGDNDFGAQLNEFRYDSQNEVIKNAYWGLYGVIYDCNLILDNIEPTTDIKKRVCAEARALRAWAHFTLAIGWNCPPLVDHVLSADIKPTNYEGGHDKLLEWCASEAEAVVNDLDERTSPTDKVGLQKLPRALLLPLQVRLVSLWEIMQVQKITSNKLSNLENTNLYPVIAGQIYSTHQETSAKK